jgi:hypothetical protein
MRVWGGEVEEGLVAGTEEGKGFALGVGSGEGGGEGVAEGRGGDEEVAGMVGAGEAVGVWRRVTGGWRWESKVGGVFAIGPVGWVVLVMDGRGGRRREDVGRGAYQRLSSMKKARCSLRARP